jgi:hypothetical protein
VRRAHVVGLGLEMGLGANEMRIDGFRRSWRCRFSCILLMCFMRGVSFPKKFFFLFIFLFLCLELGLTLF